MFLDWEQSAVKCSQICICEDKMNQSLPRALRKPSWLRPHYSVLFRKKNWKLIIWKKVTQVNLAFWGVCISCVSGLDIPIFQAPLNTILALIWPGAQPDHHFHRCQTLRENTSAISSKHKSSWWRLKSSVLGVASAHRGPQCQKQENNWVH